MTHSYIGHTLGVVSLAASADGCLVASSALDSHVRVWNARTHETRVVIATPPGENWHLGFIPDSTQGGGGSSLLAVAAGAAKAVKVYDVSEGDSCGAEKITLKLPDAGTSSGFSSGSDGTGCFAMALAVSNDGSRLVCGAADGVVAVFDVGTGKFLHKLEGHNQCVRDVTFSPDGKTVFTACDDGHVHVYDAHNRSLLESLSGHEGWVLGVSASRDGNALATCGADAKVKLWDIRERRCAQTSSSQKEAVWGVAFGGTSDVLATVSDDKSVATFQYVA
jgi:WD repeat-containing protein 61